MECEHVSKENVLQVLKQQHLFHIHGLRSTKWYSTLLRFIKIFSSFYRKNTVEFLMCDDNLETIGITLNTGSNIDCNQMAQMTIHTEPQSIIQLSFI